MIISQTILKTYSSWDKKNTTPVEVCSKLHQIPVQIQQDDLCSSIFVLYLVQVFFYWTMTLNKFCPVRFH